MPLVSGTELGPYEVLSPIGAGGMGEVYLARDGKLDRQVAIKVLPDAVDAEASQTRREPTIVLNWITELEALAPGRGQ